MLYYMTMDRLVASMGEEAPLSVLQDVTNHGQSTALPQPRRRRRSRAPDAKLPVYWAESAHETANALAQAVARHKGAVDSVCDGAREAAVGARRARAVPPGVRLARLTVPIPCRASARRGGQAPSRGGGGGGGRRSGGAFAALCWAPPPPRQPCPGPALPARSPA